MPKKWILLALIAVLLIGAVPLAAQDSGKPVVYAVMLYSPSCPHCHQVINEDLPDILAEFGDQLQILLIDVTNQSGNALARSAYEYYAIPRDRWVVPMLIVNDEVLIGGVDIPNRLPAIVREGLAAGGIPIPGFPGMREVFEAALTRESDAEANTVSETTAVETSAATIAEKLASDPIANAAAIIVLIGLVVSLGVVILFGMLSLNDQAMMAWLQGSTARAAVILTLVAGAIVAVTLVAQSAGDALATVLSWLMLIGLIGTLGLILLRGMRPALVPLVAAVGLVDAIYLAYVEVTQSEAVCGIVGNCNAVQQSPYAQVLGVPVGVIGIIGYVAIAIAWGVAQRGSGRSAQTARTALLVMALVGTVFSIYLTFLEPFVIGATCAWCLISALMMLALLWLVAADGWKAVAAFVKPAEKNVLHKAV